MANPRIMQEIVLQYAEDAAFLWLLRDVAVSQPHYKLSELTRLDNRVEAHIDGLRVAGESGWQLALQQLEATPEAGETFAAGVLAAESGLPVRIASVVKAAGASPKNPRAVISALGWLPQAAAMERVKPWFTSDVPLLRRVAIGAAAIHRRDPGPALQRSLEDSDLGVKARAFRAVGELGAGTHLPALRKNVRHADPTCRFWANWSAARLGDKAAVAELQMIAQAETHFRPRAVDVVARTLDPNACLRWLDVLGQLPGGERLAIQGYGRLGESAAVPRLLQAMKTPALARVAGESLTFITGVDLDAEKLAGKKPEGFEAGPNDDPADENVEMDPDDNLPWPDLERISKWWEKNLGNFRPGQRLLLGKPITPDWCREVLRIGKQRQRAAAALELALREPNKPLFEVRAPGFRQ